MTHRLGGEVRLTPEEAAQLSPDELAKKLKITEHEQTKPWDLGMDNFEKPTVITGFPGKEKRDG